MRSPVIGALALGFVAVLLGAAAESQPKQKVSGSWRGCCGLTPWAQAGPMASRRESTGGPLYHGYAYIVGGSALRHHLGVTGQIPAQYSKLHNPLPPTVQNAQRGAAVYEAQCSSCHGVTGLGDGPASKTLKPQPAQLAWLVKVPSGRRDPFMYWSIVDGGQKLATDMPSYKGKLNDEEIWAVIGYIEARLPQPERKR